MTISKSVAQRVRTAALVLVSASFGSIFTNIAVAQAYQDNMVNARNSVQQAIGYLNAATANKGGHRANAISLCQQAIREINLGMRFAHNNRY